MLLDRLMPEYEFHEIHQVRLSAPPERTLDAVTRATPGEMPLVRLLFGIRSLPGRIAGKRGLPTRSTQPLLQQMLAAGFVLLAEEPGREVVCGVIGQMWKVRGGMAPTVRDVQEFVAFEERGYAKAAMNFYVEAAGGGTRLTTETRVHTTDADACRKFGRYWRVIQPGSAAIRRSWLRAAKRRAELGQGIRRRSTA